MMRMLALALLLVVGSNVHAAPRTNNDEAEKSADDPEKVICKRFNETGSLVRSKRVCKSKRDWERERDSIRSLGNTSACGNIGTGGNCG